MTKAQLKTIAASWGAPHSLRNAGVRSTKTGHLVEGVVSVPQAVLNASEFGKSAIGPDFVFMDDNARPHQTFDVQQLLKSEDIVRIDWPKFSPDLNRIENVRNALGMMKPCGQNTVNT
ncbi:hypothetical protein TNCV_839611 [Trichonephila clavipes]|nr:hypothetical protein TNCV_839611 [Trichonephila clavipes]